MYGFLKHRVIAAGHRTVEKKVQKLSLGAKGTFRNIPFRYS